MSRVAITYAQACSGHFLNITLYPIGFLQSFINLYTQNGLMYQLPLYRILVIDAVEAHRHQAVS